MPPILNGSLYNYQHNVVQQTDSDLNIECGIVAMTLLQAFCVTTFCNHLCVYVRVGAFVCASLYGCVLMVCVHACVCLLMYLHPCACACVCQSVYIHVSLHLCATHVCGVGVFMEWTTSW